MSGESWLAVVSIESERSGFTISQAQPEPNKAPGGSCGGELLLEAFERAETPADSLREILAGILVARAGVRGQQLPEHRVVGVPAAVVADDGADVLGDGAEVGDQYVHVAGVCLRVSLEGVVEVGDVAAVVLRVVQTHRLLVYVRLQSVVGVGQFRQLVGHHVSSFLFRFSRLWLLR